MSRTRFSIGAHELELVIGVTGKECILYDNRTVSNKRNFSLLSTHHFEVIENGEFVKYEVSFKSTLSGLLKYKINCNNVLIKKGIISSITFGLLRIFFFSIGFSLAYKFLVILNFPWYRKLIVSSYTSSDLIWLYSDVVINFVFGVLFFVFACFLKEMIVKIPNFITTVLWIRIGMMIVTSPLLFWNWIQSHTFFDYRLGIILRIGFIWLLWFVVENYKEIAKELKLKLDSLD